MRNRQLIQLLIYPRHFLSLAIPYKGKYFVRMRVYQKKLLNGKITFAYPKIYEFPDAKSLKQYQKGKVEISKEDVLFDTESFFLFYSNQKVNLNTYCTFRLEYDEIRQFKTFVEFELVRKCDSFTVEDGCVPANKGQPENDIICKEVYLLNNYKKLDVFERVYFQHYEFYCALDLYICTVSLGKVYRNYKFQMVQYLTNQKLQKRSKTQSSKQTPSLSECIQSTNGQVIEYTQLRKICLKYQHLAKFKKSFLFSLTPSVNFQNFQDLSHLTYSYKEYDKKIYSEAIAQLEQDKKMVNDNIRYLFTKLPGVVKQIPYNSFKVLIADSIKKKFDLKKKYLLKKVPMHSILQKSTEFIKPLNPRLSFDNSSEMTSAQMIKSSYTFRQNRKLQKQQFVHIRREQFLKAFQIINLKDCTFPMMLIQKSLKSMSQNLSNGNLEKILQVTENSHEKSSSEGESLIVLIHGYQGSHHDVKKLKNYIEQLCPNMKILPITSIEKNINENIEFLGEKVASEIEFFMVNSYQNIKKINFIGFSLGGVLARACLKHLQKYKGLMNMLITLASPHLGVSESQNTLVNFGVWYLSKIDKVKNIKDLNFQSVTEQDSFLMKLSTSEQISWFKKVVLVSSSEDEFVPHYSARIIPETKNSEINKMAINLISKIQNCERIEVWFDVDKKTSLDKIIGRKSHIEFIENYSFLQMLCKIYKQEF